MRLISSLIKNFPNFASPETVLMTHGVIGNTSDFGSAESWFEPRWVNKNVATCGVFVEWPAGKANWARSLSRHDEKGEASSGSPGGSTERAENLLKNNYLHIERTTRALGKLR
jgi:hypothetical protein